jgi:hypothetical protein
MPIVRPTFKIDILKMEQAFQMGYRQGEKVFFVSPKNWQREEVTISSYQDSWSLVWKKKNHEFEEFYKRI